MANGKVGPSLKVHKASGHAYAYFNRKQVWFGASDDPETFERFVEFRLRWEANGRVLPEPGQELRPPELTVADLVALYLEVSVRPDHSVDRR